MTWTTLLVFAAISAAAIATPGPTVLLALNNGAVHGMRRALFGICGAALSDLILIGAVSLGLGALLAASESLFSWVKWVGVAYFVWLSVQLWRSRPQGLSRGDGDAAASDGDVASFVSPRRAFTRSLLVALTNPKGLLFFSAFLPQFVVTSEPQWPQYLTLALVFTSIDIAVMLVYALGGLHAARLLTASGLRRLNRACAAAMLSLAGMLAVYRRGAA